MTERKTARVHRTPTGYLSPEAARARSQYLKNRRVAWVVFDTIERNGKIYTNEGWTYMPGTQGKKHRIKKITI